MPAAPNLETLFDPETPVELAWKEILARYDIAGFTSREDVDLPVPRVDIQMELGASTGHLHPDRTGVMYRDAWNYRLTLGVVTERGHTDGPTHAALRARLRLIAQYSTGLLDDRALLPYHVLTSIADAGTTPSVKTIDDCDVSELSFAGIVSIHRNAWPVG